MITLTAAKYHWGFGVLKIRHKNLIYLNVFKFRIALKSIDKFKANINISTLEWADF